MAPAGGPQIRNSLFGPYLLHLRPRSFPIVLAHYLAGAAIVLPHWPRELMWEALARTVAGGAVWTVLLNGGTLAINSAFDRDTGDIGYLDNPPVVPKGLAAYAAVLLLLGLLASLLLPGGFAAAYTVCLVLSLLYSVPPVRLKAVAGMDLAINMAGYGALTFAAGALAVGPAVKPGAAPIAAPVIGLLATSFAFLFGAFYPMTQIYQIPEDTARGDNTLVVRLGARRALAYSVIALAASLGCQLGAATLSHLRIWPIGLVVAGYVMWIAFTLDWLRQVDTYPSQAGMYRALKLWAVSDVFTVIAFGFGPTLGA